MMEKIFISNSKKWQVLLNEIHSGDFYHTPSYHFLDNSGQPVLLRFSLNSEIILMPIIIRQIPKTNYKDVTSVYGYAGPLSSEKNISENTKREFQKSLNDFFTRNNIIAAFSRLHPLILYQENILSGYGEVIPLNKTVSIDTTIEPVLQRQNFDKSLKYRLNQIRKRGVEIKKADNIEEIKQFVNIYLETMKRVSANKKYFFDLNYFLNFLDSKEYNSFVLLALYEDKIIAGSLFTVYGKIMQYHLSGTKNDYLKLSPMKLLVDEARLIASELGLEHFHLGGGYGGTNDLLFNFKTAFSKNYYQFKIWLKIINENVYNNLVLKKFEGTIPEIKFFPLYRFED